MLYQKMKNILIFILKNNNFEIFISDIYLQRLNIDNFSLEPSDNRKCLQN